MKYLPNSLTALLLLLLLPASVSAHKVKIFASAEGKLISGYVYYTGGGKPKQAKIRVEDRNGERMGETIANENGEFAFSAGSRQDHIFILELADGHRATFTLKADELPESLAAAEATEFRADETVPAQEEPPLPTEINSSGREQATLQLSAEELEELIDKALTKQIRPLREQLDRYEEKIRLHDILGGIGYIVGLMGLGYFLSSRKTH